MGSSIEINDTLKLRADQGMPDNPVVGERYTFRVDDMRLYHLWPVRVFLVRQTEDGKWVFVGHAMVMEQTINAEGNCTSGIFIVDKLYDPEYVRMITINESKPGKSFF